MDWIECESSWVFCPDFADIFVRGEPLEGFEPATVIVSVDEVGQMALQLSVAVVVVALCSPSASLRQVRAF